MTELSQELRLVAHAHTDPEMSDLLFRAAEEIETTTAKLEECRKMRADLIACGPTRSPSPESQK